MTRSLTTVKSCLCLYIVAVCSIFAYVCCSFWLKSMYHTGHVFCFWGFVVWRLSQCLAVGSTHSLAFDIVSISCIQDTIVIEFVFVFASVIKCSLLIEMLKQASLFGSILL